MAQFAVLGAAWKLATGTKKCVEFLQSFQGVYEEGYILWHTVESLQEPLRFAIVLRSRHEAFKILANPLMLCKFILSMVEKLLEKDEDEEGEGRPENEASWTKWLIHTKDGKQRKDKIIEILPKLTHVIATLNLALTTVQVKMAGHREKLLPGSEFEFIPDAFISARRLIREFEYGRTPKSLLFHAVLWRLDEDGTLQEDGLASVTLLKDEEAALIKCECLPDEDYDDDEAWNPLSIPISAKSQVFLTWKYAHVGKRPKSFPLKEEFEELESASETPVIVVNNKYWFEYVPADDGLSVEAGEALILGLIAMDGFAHSSSDNFEAERDKDLYANNLC